MKKYYITLISLFLIFGIGCSSKHSKPDKKPNTETASDTTNEKI